MDNNRPALKGGLILQPVDFAGAAALSRPMSGRALDPISLRIEAQAPDAFADALAASFARHGFAVVADHGLDPTRLAAAMGEIKALFALPEAVKRRSLVEGGKGQRGYTAFGVEVAKGSAEADLKEFWHVGRELPQGHPYRPMMPDNVWPRARPALRQQALWLYDALDQLGLRILRSIGRSLGLPAGYFDEATRDGNSVLRLLHYPPTPAEGSAVRAGPHEDINAITLLLGAEEAGLEILNPDGTWRAVSPPQGCVVVNIGDMLARLTNDSLPSTTHRVANPPPDRRGLARYSTPFFLHFRPDFVIRTLPGCVTEARPDRYPEPITAHAFLGQRLKDIGLG
jgi:isopenicillin N synthase-like dioxygenase